MADLEIGSPAPKFSLPANNNQQLGLSDFAGKYVVLYFYPKDDTPGCTKEAIAFTQAKAEFEALGAVIIGMSKDPVAKHEKFITKHDLSIALASDEMGKTIEDYGVWVEKNMYGKTYMGIERATFLIGPDGNIVQIWRKVRVKDHVAKVLDALKSELA